MDLTANDPELNGKFLGTITSDFVKIADQLKEAGYQMKSRRISDYPVFVMCRQVQPIGGLLYDKLNENLDWNYFIAMAEEFVAREILSTEGYETFVSTYKDPEEFCCLFVVDPEFTNFVFVPYPED
ncbi:MAG TPA: hypothetical protein PLK63_13025 [Catalimonadaceae bacterium]|jgi:hypothetical protein|nr:hypothetical protein [Catalimonadaceae bacterium]